MLDIKQVLKEIGAKNGLEMSLDENGACSLELADGRIMLVQERAGPSTACAAQGLVPVPRAADPRKAAHRDVQRRRRRLHVRQREVDQGAPRRQRVPRLPPRRRQPHRLTLRTTKDDGK